MMMMMIIIIIIMNYTTNTGMTMYQNQSKQVMKVRLPYYGINKFELLLYNKPVIIIRDSKKGTCWLLGVAIPGDKNVIKK
jgi:hypothetical protein